MANYAVFVEGLEDLTAFKDLSASIERAAFQAINKTAERGRTRAARRILAQVNLPASYVSPGQKRLYVSQKARAGSLEAKITARGRATSLARFVTNERPGGGLTVQVGASKSVILKRAFLLKLRSGNSDMDTKSNMGLAVRLKPGESLRNRYSAKMMKNGLYLLYGPSVAQIFAANSGRGVAEDMSAETADQLETEFLRLLDLKGFK